MDIQQQGFSHSMRGYDVEEVDVFLEQVASEIEVLLHKNAELKSRLKNTEERLTSVEAQLEEKGKMDSAISAAFIAAQRSAEAMKEDARVAGEKVYRDAEAKSREIVREALVEKQKALNEIDHLKKSRERFRADYIAMLQHFSTEAEQVFPASAKPAVEVQPQQTLRPVAEQLAPQQAQPEVQQASQQTQAQPAVSKQPELQPGQLVSDFSGFGDHEEFDIEEID